MTKNLGLESYKFRRTNEKHRRTLFNFVIPKNDLEIAGMKGGDVTGVTNYDVFSRNWKK